MITVKVTDGNGEEHVLTQEEVYELRAAVGCSVSNGSYSNHEVMATLVHILPPPYLQPEHETEENWVPGSQDDTYVV